MHPVSFAFAGDVMIDRTDAPSILRHVSATLKGADIAYCNLEGPISDRGEKHAGKVGIGLHFRSPLNTLEALRSAGIDVVSLANNHAMDFGAPALQQTIELLDAANIAHAGAGRNRAEARKPALLTRNGLRIALLSYTSRGIGVCPSAGANWPTISARSGMKSSKPAPMRSSVITPI